MQEKKLREKTIVVIGGSSGIGLSVAQKAHEFGANIVLTSRDLSKAKSVADTIGAHVKGYALDVSDELAVNDFFESFETIDHIYVAAGSTKLGSLSEGSLEENMETFNIRLLGSLRVVRAAVGKIPALGSVTFTGGVSTDRPIAGAWVSGLGTAAAEQFARVLVMEFPNIRFNAVSPGYTDTPLWDSIMGTDKNEILATIAATLPVKKIASPEEVAAAVLFMMSNQSITGEVIHVDGGARLI
ncbi:SDR family oxidoreductase [Flavobacterium sp.]|uniref:SDR family oxidoreductase n=1 Tax=Flavobacterium sp. TaxID=239 RepID=UPI00286B1BD3|nr:SDR family oxidoreductase [Flavobacterium sp.]